MGKSAWRGERKQEFAGRALKIKSPEGGNIRGIAGLVIPRARGIVRAI